MMPVFAPGRSGLYVHWPFCAALCPYCDFAVYVRKEPPFAQYMRALKDSMREFESIAWRTIYFGGGTPSLVPIDVLAEFSSGLDATTVEEWTLEANPDDVTVEALAAWQTMGVTRLSMGVQSFDESYLTELGRRHDAKGSRTAVETALEAGFEVSIDLIFNGPKFDIATFRSDVAYAERLGVHHISSYELTIESNTAFARRAELGDLELNTENRRMTDYHDTFEILEDAGFERYEISSFARDQAYGRHNLSYWLGQPYVGIGVGAHGFRETDAGWERTAVGRDLRDFLNGDVAVDVDVVDTLEHFLELAFLGLRTRFGFALSVGGRIGAKRGDVEALERTLNGCVTRGFLTRAGDVYSPTKKGMVLADDVAAEIWQLADRDR